MPDLPATAGLDRVTGLILYEEAVTQERSRFFIVRKGKGELIMKKVFALTLAVMMVVAMFAGCGSSGASNEDPAVVKIGTTLQVMTTRVKKRLLLH